MLTDLIEGGTGLKLKADRAQQLLEDFLPATPDQAARHQVAVEHLDDPAPSGGRKVHRLSRRGNRQLNHAMHIAAQTQIRLTDTPGRGFYDRKRAGGRTRRNALRGLKRRISDAVFRQLRIDAGLVA